MLDIKNIDVDEIEKADIPEDVTPEFESSFSYKATPLDELETIDENGITFSIKELMDMKALDDEINN